ncbi:MAG: signal peptidase I [Acidimicrobiia bacterium]|nr:signal peptidase I [Acidimicrobiia bacterium]
MGYPWGSETEPYAYGPDQFDVTATVTSAEPPVGGADAGDGLDERDYDDYFDDDEDDDLVEVEATSSATRNALEWAVVLVGAVLVALLLRASLFQAFWIPSESMETTLLTNDRVLVNKLSYRLHDIHRGDVVVFTRPDQEPGEIRDLIKRVIGLPGETVEARDNSIYINGQRLHEPYLDEGIVTADFGPTVVPEGEVFVMGDNRADSYDSRWFGTVTEDQVIGRAFVLFWPVNRVSSL